MTKYDNMVIRRVIILYLYSLHTKLNGDVIISQDLKTLQNDHNHYISVNYSARFKVHIQTQSKPPSCFTVLDNTGQVMAQIYVVGHQGLALVYGYVLMLKCRSRYISAADLGTDHLALQVQILTSA